MLSLLLSYIVITSLCSVISTFNSLSQSSLLRCRSCAPPLFWLVNLMDTSSLQCTHNCNQKLRWKRSLCCSHWVSWHEQHRHVTDHNVCAAWQYCKQASPLQHVRHMLALLCFLHLLLYSRWVNQRLLLLSTVTPANVGKKSSTQSQRCDNLLHPWTHTSFTLDISLLHSWELLSDTVLFHVSFCEGIDTYGPTALPPHPDALQPYRQRRYT